MAETMIQKVKNETKAFLIAPIYPFLQKDWMLKMWIFAVLAYVPIVNVIIARGWRMDYIRRIGWQLEEVLPKPKDALTFLKNGLLLWLSTGAFLIVPTIVVVLFGLGGWLALWNDLMGLLALLASYFLAGSLSTGEFLRSLVSFIFNELLAELLVFLIENIWLTIYVPIYRVGMIRFALTGKLIKSHLALVQNFTFLYRNFIDIILMYAFNVFNFALFIVVSTILTITVVGIPLIPIITFYMPYWNSGYEYGMLARVMVEQEGLTQAGPVAAQAQPAEAAAAPELGLAPVALPLVVTEEPSSVLRAGAASAGCPSCGAANPASYRFCANCGAAIGESSLSPL